LIMFGFLTLLGKGFGSIVKQRKFGNDSLGIFLFGIFFALGWTACIGPIISGVLIMAGILQNFGYAALLLFSYSLGIFIPFFLLAFFFDKYNLADSRLMKAKQIVVEVNEKEYKIILGNLIAGLLFIFIGLLFVIYRGTNLFNILDPLNMKIYFYTLQNKLISAISYYNKIGAVLLIVFGVLLYLFLRKKKSSVKKLHEQN